MSLFPHLPTGGGMEGGFISWVAAFTAPVFLLNGLSQGRTVYVVFAVILIAGVMVTLWEGLKAARRRQLVETLVLLVMPVAMGLAGSIYGLINSA